MIGRRAANQKTDQGYDLRRNLQSVLFLKELRWEWTKFCVEEFFFNKFVYKISVLFTESEKCSCVMYPQDWVNPECLRMVSVGYWSNDSWGRGLLGRMLSFWKHLLCLCLVDKFSSCRLLSITEIVVLKYADKTSCST